MSLPNEESIRKREYAWEKTNSAEMQALVRAIVKKYRVDIPNKYQEIFYLSHSMFERKASAYAIVSNRSRFNDPQQLFSLINDDVQGKFCAVIYHLTNAHALENQLQENAQQIIGHAESLGIEWPVTIGISTNKLELEYESFILQCRACLDHFVVSLSYYFGFFTTDIEALRQKVREFSTKNDKAAQIVELLKDTEQFYGIIKSKSRAFISELCDRDKIAHKGRVSLRPLNITVGSQAYRRILPIARNVENEKDIFSLPELTSFMDTTCKNLFEIILKAYRIIFEKS